MKRHGASGKSASASASARRLLRRLDRLKSRFGDAGTADEKRALLAALAKGPLPGAGDVRRLHEILCFLRAYPDDAALLSQVETMLVAFDRRADLRRHREALVDSGIAGTPIDFRFFAPTASWLARRWGDRLALDWKGFRNRDRLARWLPLLTLESETPALDEYDFDAREWIALLKGPGETDASFLIRRFDALRMSSFAREKLYDELDPPIRLSPGPDTPSRSRAKYAGSPVVPQTRPLSKERPSLPDEVLRRPSSIRDVSRAEARRLIDLARESMITRSRDLDVFCWADVRDVRLVDCGEGLQFACLGAVPERRLLLEAVYGFLTLKNGVPIGYVLASALFRSSEVAYNVFETYRGGESARVYGRFLATLHALFGADAFAIDPYQVGRGNEEAIRSGAWWFYQKMGFRPRDAAALRIMRRELGRMKANPGHRSSPATLRRLAETPLYLDIGTSSGSRKKTAPRSDILGVFSGADVGLKIVRHLAERFGSRREEGERHCADEAARRLGLRSLRGFNPDERMAWRRWGPVITILPGLDRWSDAEKRELIAIVRAKGGARESDFVHRFDRHRRLRRAVLELAEVL